MPQLGVNIDHIATIREVRKTDYPDLLHAVNIIEEAGADSIVCHLREDRRHIQDRDVCEIKKNLTIPLNLEMAATPAIQKIALLLKPTTITLVPEKREELTTEGGLNVLRNQKFLQEFIKPFSECDIRVSMFVEPDEGQIEASHACGVHAIEIHTGIYANSIHEKRRDLELSKIHNAVLVAQSLDLFVACGHGLHYTNTKLLREACPTISEYNIGHAIIANAIFVGLEKAVKDMKEKLI